MTDIAAAIGAVLDRLTAAGIRAVADERDVNPPCLLLALPSLAYRFGKGGWDATWSAFVIVPDSGRDVTLVNLGQLLDAVQTALAGAVVTATAASVAGVDGAAPLPAYQLAWTSRITE